MAILNPQLPPEIAAAFETGLHTFLPGPNDRVGVVERFAGAEPQLPTLEELGPLGRIGLRVPVFVLGLKDLADSRGAGAAVMAGWRFYAGNAQRKVVMGRLSKRPDGPWKLTGVYYGDQIWATIKAWRAVEAMPEVRESDYDLRVLTLPALSIDAFWLAARTQGKEDLVVPFPPGAPNAGGLEQKVYTMPHFLATIRPRALMQLQGE